MQQNNLTDVVLRKLANRREVEEHTLMRSVPSHLRGELKDVLKEMISQKVIISRKSKNRILYHVK